jgi:hypothetical protein
MVTNQEQETMAKLNINKKFIKLGIAFLFIGSFLNQSVWADRLNYLIKIESRHSDLSANDLKICNNLDGLATMKKSSANERKNSAPVGVIIFLPDEQLPTASVMKQCGYDFGAGQSLEIVKYTDLYMVTRCAYGCNDQNHFNLPDFKGRFFQAKR